MSRKTFISNGLLSLGSLAAALLAAEAVVRISLHSKVPVRLDRPAYYYSSERAATLQDDYHEVHKPARAYRVAVVGDSFAFAPKMQFDDAFPKRLERMLKTRSTGLEAEVVNFGVPGYSTSHEVAAVRDAVKGGADLVVLEITLNDMQVKPLRPTGMRPNNPFEAEKFNRGVYSWWKTAAFVRERISNSQSHKSYKEYHFRLANDEKKWRLFRISLKQIMTVAREHDVPIAAVVFPLFGLPLDERYPFHPIHDKIEKLLETLDMPYLDLFESVRGVPLERLQVVPGADFHPNEIGHRIAAEAIYKWLSENHYLPAELSLDTYFVSRNDIRKRNAQKLSMLP